MFAVKLGNLKFWHEDFSENREERNGNVLVTSTGKDLKFPVAAQLETCKYFIIVNPSSGKYSSIPNTANFYKDKIGSFISDSNIAAVITGTMNIDTYQIFESLRVDLYTGVTGTGNQVIKLYQTDKLVEFSESVSSRKEKRMFPERNSLNSREKIFF